MKGTHRSFVPCDSRYGKNIDSAQMDVGAMVYEVFAATRLTGLLDVQLEGT